MNKNTSLTKRALAVAEGFLGIRLDELFILTSGMAKVAEPEHMEVIASLQRELATCFKECGTKPPEAIGFVLARLADVVHSIPEGELALVDTTVKELASLETNTEKLDELMEKTGSLPIATLVATALAQYISDVDKAVLNRDGKVLSVRHNKLRALWEGRTKNHEELLSLVGVAVIFWVASLTWAGRVGREYLLQNGGPEKYEGVLNSTEGALEGLELMLAQHGPVDYGSKKDGPSGSLRMPPGFSVN